MFRNSIAVALVVATLALPAVARADETAARSAAIAACRAEASVREGVQLDRVRLDQVRVRHTLIRVDLDVWRNGALQNIRCEVPRTDGPAVATLATPTRAVAAR